MSERRSGRSRKEVDYSKFEGDDDDFANPTPPGKHSQKDRTQKENSRKRQQHENVTERGETKKARKERKSLDELRYERELQAAMEMSLSNSPEAASPAPPNLEVEGNLGSSDADVEGPAPQLTLSVPAEEAARPTPASAEREDEIEVLGRVPISPEVTVINPPSHQRRAAREARRKVSVKNDDDSDYLDSEGSDYAQDDVPSDDDDDDDDDYDENDSDFDDGKKKKKKKVPVKKAKQPKDMGTKKGSGRAKSKPVSKPAQQCPVAKSAVAKVTGAMRAASSAGRLTPRASANAGMSAAATQVWKPPSSVTSPGSALGRTTAKTPPSGLRLGLSRNQRVRSLHPTVMTQQ